MGSHIYSNTGISGGRGASSKNPDTSSAEPNLPADPIQKHIQFRLETEVNANRYFGLALGS